MNISGKEALIALANGEGVQMYIANKWEDLRRDISWRSILGENYKLRLKPRTINLDGIEVPAPFKPKDIVGERLYYINMLNQNGYDWKDSSHYKESDLVWRTEEEIKQVVEALRNAFNP